jgi:hypothetical protein
MKVLMKKAMSDATVPWSRGRLMAFYFSRTASCAFTVAGSMACIQALSLRWQDILPQL